MHDLTGTLRDAIAALPSTRQFIVGLSGGPDSTALAHALTAVMRPGPVRALHVDHGLSPDSGAWAASCQRLCRNLGIPLDVRVAEARRTGGESVEQWARRARYRIFEAVAGREGHTLCLAHHRDDQVETVMIRLMRGAGPRGLSGMPGLRRLGAGWLWRPFLGVPRSAIDDYLRAQALEAIHDPSNSDPGIDRGFLRATVLPPLRARRPGFDRAVERSATLLGEAAALIEEVGRDDLERCRGGAPGTLGVAAIRRLGVARRRNVWRAWFAERGLAAPGIARLAELDRQVLVAGVDRRPALAWDGRTVARYRGLVHVVAGCPGGWEGREWHCAETLMLPHGALSLVETEGGPVSRTWAEAAPRLRVAPRRGGERIRPAGHRHRAKVKHLMQARGIPPWERGRLPLVHAGDDLIAVPGVVVAESIAASPGEGGYDFVWQPRGTAEDVSGR